MQSSQFISDILSGFSDGNTVSDYALESATACIKMGLISGRNNGALSPKDNMTRAEVAVIIQRLLKKYNMI